MSRRVGEDIATSHLSPHGVPTAGPLLSWVSMAQIPINIAELVGNTPLVALPRMLDDTAAENGVELFAKLEAFNPGEASRTGSGWR